MWPALVAIFEKSPGDVLQKVIFFSFKGLRAHTHTQSHFVSGHIRIYLWPGLLVENIKTNIPRRIKSRVFQMGREEKHKSKWLRMSQMLHLNYFLRRIRQFLQF